jgi:hypothetical protein
VKILACMWMVVACLAAQQTTKTSPPPAAKPAKKTAPARMDVPKDAVETSPGFYRWTDKDGKAWMYRRSPFGVTRFPAAAEPGYLKQNAVADQTTAVEEGDSIRFARASPFGKRTWVRKKTELNDEEQAIWEHQQKTGAASRSAEKE